MPLHDLKCVDCGHESYDEFIRVKDLKKVRPCSKCGGPTERRWDISQRPIGVARNTTVHPRERAVVYRHPGTGNVVYPPTNNSPMPERYRKQGYVREDLDTLQKMDSFCKEEGVSNEKISYDSNGHADAYLSEMP